MQNHTIFEVVDFLMWMKHFENIMFFIIIENFKIILWENIVMDFKYDIMNAILKYLIGKSF